MAGGRIVEIDLIADPEKLEYLRRSPAGLSTH
jgi:hypothetical protein